MLIGRIQNVDAHRIVHVAAFSFTVSLLDIHVLTLQLTSSDNSLSGGTVNILAIQLCILQSIPGDMEFDPESTPPCYKTKDEVFFTQSQLLRVVPPNCLMIIM